MQRDTYYLLETKQLVIATQQEIQKMVRDNPNLLVRKATELDIINVSDLNVIQVPVFDRGK